MKAAKRILILESEDWVEVWADQHKIYQGSGVISSIELEDILKALGHDVTARFGQFQGQEFMELD